MEAVPTGLSAPVVIRVSDTFATFQWAFPLQTHGVITFAFQLSIVGNSSSSSVISQGTNTAGTLAGLLPATSYSLVLKAANTAGIALSSNILFTTLEAAPASVGSFTVLESTVNTVTLQWAAPTSPNGLITEYRIHIGLLAETMVVAYTGVASVLRAILGNLVAYTTYYASLTACTVVGCTAGPALAVTTKEDTPLDQAAPIVAVLSDTVIAVQWERPASPRGLILRYEVSRILIQSDTQPVLIYNGSGLSTNDVSLLPYTAYRYTVISFNSVGTARSFASSTVVTKEASPVGMRAPLIVQGVGFLHVKWLAPLVPNGVVTGYQLNGGSPDAPIMLYRGLELSFVHSSLESFTNYQYMVIVSNQIGSTLSNWQTARTCGVAPLPLARPPLSSSTGQPPLFPSVMSTTTPSQPTAALNVLVPVLVRARPIW
jgi:usherin